MKKFWVKLHEIVSVDRIDLGYTGKIGMIAFEPSSLDLSASDTSDLDDTTIPGKKHINCLPTIVTVTPEKQGSSVTRNEANLFFIIEGLFYIDIESILKLIQYFKYCIKRDYEMLKTQMACCSELPFIVINDFVLYNEAVLQHNKEVKPIGLQMKANIYPFKKFKKVNFVSPVEMKLNNIQTNIKTLCSDRLTNGHNADYFGLFTPADVIELKDDVVILFTDMCGKIPIEYLTHVTLCKFPNIQTTLKDNIPHNVQQLARLSDIVFAIENYNVLYLKDFIQNYLDLIANDDYRESCFSKIPSRWSISFLTLERSVIASPVQKDYLFIGFFFKGISKPKIQSRSNPEKVVKRISFEEQKDDYLSAKRSKSLINP